MRYESALRFLAERDPNLVVMTAENRAAIRNLPRFLGDRFIDVGICEQTMVGAAAGLALRGRHPVVHALAAFLVLRAFEFIRTDVAIAALPVVFVGGVPGFLSEANGPTHQAIEDVALMRTLPNMQVFCPADERELVSALPHVLATRAPSYIRFNAGPAALSDRTEFEVGQAEVCFEGSDVTILTYGFLLGQAISARSKLLERGHTVRLVNMRTLKPVDEHVLLRAARESRLVATLEDHLLTGGLYSILAEVLLRHGVTCPVLPIALEDRWFKPALLGDVLAHEGFTGDQIADRIAAHL